MRKSSASKTPPPSQFPSWATYALGAVSGVVITLGVLQFSQSSISSNDNAESNIQEAKLAEQKLIPITFYDKLKEETEYPSDPDFELETEVKTKVEQPAPSVHYQSKQSNSDNDQYLIQVGSFKHKKDAEQFKVEMIMLNLIQAHVSRAQIGKDETRYRVLIGPLNGKRDLEKTRKTLQKNQYDLLVLKQKPKTAG